MKIANKDPGKGHFYVSIIKSIFRFIASGLLAWAGYVLWSANEYTDIFIADTGLFMMLAGAMLFLAEALGIVEEIV
jgi:uncharacterized membrane protein